MIQKFNPPPGWNVPQYPWTPPAGFKKDESWPDPPADWQFWVLVESDDSSESEAQPNVNFDLDSLRARIESEIRSRIVELDDKLSLQEAGLYEYHHPLANADAYKDSIEQIRQEIRISIRSGSAIKANSRFAFDNSISKGSKFAQDISGLALNGFNQEVENTIRTLRAGTLDVAKKRILNSADKIAKFGKMMDLTINPDYLQLRIRELELVADYAAKLEEQKQLQREERERLREEEKARRELEAQKQKLLKEKSHYQNAIAAMKERGSLAEEAVLESRLKEIEEAITLNDYRLSNVKAGYVYVISNEGAFGPGVLKIGMTRRLEPMDRVKELGDASVPFRFAVHALFFSDDAMGLESRLHESLAAKRLNQDNQRKEFFFASPAEVRDLLKEQVGALLEFDEGAISEEYLQSKHYWPSQEPGP
jgi:hypothetical protein